MLESECSCLFVNGCIWLLSGALTFLMEKHSLDAGYHSLVRVLLFVAAVDSELQAGRDSAGCLLVPTCVPTHEVLQHSTQISWDPNSLLHREVPLVVYKCYCTQSTKPKT